MTKSKTLEKPFISAILVTRNEGAYIEKALLSYLNQDYPTSRYEILIVDGESTDDTVQRAKDVIEKIKIEGREVPECTFINNPQKILAAGWNIGIKASKGEYVVRIDAHGEAALDFISNSVETMLKVDAVCVGGKLTTKSLGDENKIVSNILSSSFGVGNSSFRVSNTACYADTAVYGLYKRNVFDEIGYFNESLVRNQDIELHTRIKKSGGKFYFNPEISSIYYSRPSVKKMLRQGYGNGKWNLIIVRYNEARLSLRHLVPLFFVLFILLTTIAGFFFFPIWWLELAVLALYFSLALIASIKFTFNPLKILAMMGLYFALHISYGVGSIVGCFIKIKN
ncbi:glycosyltransferase family 2 protein [Odoribacter laneus]|uniref:Glycosyltransferase 2-like domain-containing protein n=1 Tax=Odoribacter laneus YIT 12061 TaxID=742817 RepID=H1DF96_9BACT|nr:glycosyltransferase family 2 protein [Odoribacter laneus]EHP49414.1 hypothetical protein HMPREF9449_00932 [Odoribacter laneus YIT 12061]